MPTTDIPATTTDSLNLRRLLPYLGLLFILSLAQYSLSLNNNFVWDAETTFTEDPTIRDLKNLPQNLLEESNKLLTNEGNQVSQLKYYRPLTRVLHILEYSVFESDPLGYKAVNVVLNAVVVVLLFMVVLSATNNPVVALVAALLFSVNPARAEAVYWAYSDSYVLMSLFSLAALYMYQRGKIAIALIAFVTSLFFHEMAILLPVIIFLYTFLIDGKRTLKAYLPSIMFLILAAMFVVLRTIAVGAVPVGDVEPGTFANTAAVIIQRYTKMFFLPDAPIAIYPGQLFTDLTYEVILSYMVLGVLMTLALWLWVHRRAYLFWYLWFFIWLSVSLNIGAFGEYLMAEKILYLASAGFCVLLAQLIVEFNHRKSLIYALLGCLTIFHSAITFSRDSYWQDTRTYLIKGLEYTPDFYMAHYTLGRDYVKTREFDKALIHFRLTTDLKPQFAKSYNAIGVIHFLRNELDQSIKAHEKAIAIDPGNPLFYNNLDKAREKKNNLYAHHLELGHRYAQMGKIQAAVQQYEKSITLAGPKDKVKSMEALGLLLGQSGNSERSLEIYKQITNLEPDRSSAWVGVGNNLWYMGRLSAAADAYRSAFEADNSNRKACHNLIMVLKKLGKTEEAARYATCAAE